MFQEVRGDNAGPDQLDWNDGVNHSFGGEDIKREPIQDILADILAPSREDDAPQGEGGGFEEVADSGEEDNGGFQTFRGEEGENAPENEVVQAPLGFQDGPDEIETLTKQNEKLKKRCHELKSRLHDSKASHKGLVNKNHQLQLQIDELMAPPEDPEAAGVGFDMNNLQDAVARKKREAEEAKAKREEMRRRRLAEGGGDAFEILDDYTRRGANDYFTELYTQVSEFIIDNWPLRVEVDRIKARYGSTLDLYFAMLQMMTVSNGFLVFIWLTLYVLHIVNGSQSKNDGVDPLTPGITLNSSFTWSESTHFIGCIYATMLYLIITALSRYLHADKAAHTVVSFEEDFETSQDAKSLIALRLARTCLNPWDFDMGDAEDIDNQRSTVVQAIKVILAEDHTADEVGMRDDNDWYALYAKRAGGFVMNLILIAAQWTSIGWLTINQEALKEDAEGTILESVKAFIVPFAISVINAILPLATTFITAYEAWDSKAFSLQVEVVRLYLCRILNALLLTFAYYQLLVGRAIYQGTEVVALAKWNGCHEDQTANEFLILVISDWLVPKVILFVSTYGFNWLEKYSNGEGLCDGKFAKQQFALSTEIIQLMYSQILMWTLLPYWPPIVFIMWLLHYLSFMFMAWMLEHYFAKPQGIDAKDTGKVVSLLYIATLLISQVSYVFYLSGPVQRTNGCSPFFNPSGNITAIATAPANDVIEQYDGADSFWVKLLMNRYFLFGTILVVTMFIIKAQNYHEAFLVYYQTKVDGDSRRIKELDLDLRKMKRENTLLKLQVNIAASHAQIKQD